MAARDTGRGAGWVWLQFGVIAATVGAGFLEPGWPEGAHTALTVAGAVLGAAGAIVVVWSSRLLGRAFTPYPRPAPAGRLVERGPYRIVRHPVYAGGLAFFLGYGLYASVPALALTAVLAVVWGLKARVEEVYLRDRYPGYGGYERRVRFRLVPFVY